MGAGAPRFAVAGISQQLLVADAICKASVREVWAAENIRQRLEHLTSGLVLRPDAAAIATDCRKRSTLRFLSVQAVPKETSAKEVGNYREGSMENTLYPRDGLRASGKELVESDSG